MRVWRARSTRGHGVVVLISLLASTFAVSPANAQTPLVQTTGTGLIAEVGIEWTVGCVTTSVYVSASRGVLAGKSYDKLRPTDATFQLLQTDVCTDTLLRGIYTSSAEASVDLSRHSLSASAAVTVLDCVAPAYDCEIREVPIDVTWDIDNPAFQRYVDTYEDMADGGALSNQLSLLRAATVVGVFDGTVIDPASVQFAQVAFNVGMNVIRTP